VSNTDYAVATTVTPEVIVVTVYHDPARSYSRSVLPRAKRVTAGIIKGQGRNWAMTEVDYDQPRVIGNAVTVATFRPI
jgi:hypothetical protein